MGVHESTKEVEKPENYKAARCRKLKICEIYSEMKGLCGRG